MHDPALDSKNKIMGILYDVNQDSPASLCDATNKICTIMEYTAGLWIALDYDYKAREICQILINYIECLLNHMDLHPSQKKALDKRREMLYNVITQSLSLRRDSNEQTTV